MLAHAMQVPSPRYYGQFNPTPLPIGVWADALSSSLNQNAGAWRNGPDVRNDRGARAPLAVAS